MRKYRTGTRTGRTARVIILFVISIVVVGLAYKQIVKVTADIPKMEEKVLLEEENKYVLEGADVTGKTEA